MYVYLNTSVSTHEHNVLLIELNLEVCDGGVLLK